MERVEVLHVERVSEGFLSVDEATVRVDGGAPIKRTSVERGDAVAAVLYDPSREVLLFVRQFRYPTLRHGDPFPLELVAGAIDPGETPEEAIRREIEEEIGYRPSRLVEGPRFWGSPGGLSEQVHVFYAEVSEEDRVHEGNLLEGENVELVELSVQEILEMIQSGMVRDAKALIGMFWFGIVTNHGRRGWFTEGDAASDPRCRQNVRAGFWDKCRSSPATQGRAPSL